MTKSFWAISLSLVFLASTFTASADPVRAEKRQEKQENRIEQGVNNGELTKREARHLKQGQRHVQHVENRVTADGVVTPKEKLRLEHAQNVQSRKIFRAKHNKRDRN